jgi:hypothetical protein
MSDAKPVGKVYVFHSALSGLGEAVTSSRKNGPPRGELLARVADRLEASGFVPTRLPSASCQGDGPACCRSDATQS